MIHHPRSIKKKIFCLFLNSINWEIFGQDEMRFEKSFKSYSNNQWLLCREYIWYKIKHYWWNDINYTKKLVIERLSQTTNDFSNIWGIMTCY